MAAVFLGFGAEGNDDDRVRGQHAFCFIPSQILKQSGRWFILALLCGGNGRCLCLGSQRSRA
jgi:hypothetical protein